MFPASRTADWLAFELGILPPTHWNSMKIVVVEFAGQGQDDQQVSGPGLRGPGVVRPCPRPAGQGRLGRSRPRFQHDLGGRRQVAEAAQRHRPRRQGRRQADPRHRPRPRGRGDLLARAGGAEGEAGAEDADGRARGVQRHHQAGGARRDEAPARDRRRAGRRLSRPPRARLSGRLHAVAGAVAQAAGRALGRPGAVGGAAAGLRPRARDREVRRRANTGRWWPTLATPRSETFEARLVGADGKKIQRLDIGSGAAGRAVQARARDRGLHRRLGRGQARAGATRHRRSPPRRCSRRRAASSASRRRTPCASRSGSTKASTSAARPSASSPICEPTASTSPPEAIAAARQRDRSRLRPANTCRPRRASYHDQGEERPGGARGDPPDRPRAPPEETSRRCSMPTRPGSTS